MAQRPRPARATAQAPRRAQSGVGPQPRRAERRDGPVDRPRGRADRPRPDPTGGPVEAPRLEVVNLTRGVFCPHLDGKHPAYPIGPYRYSRIQSTQCEMKQWDKVVLSSFGPDLWMHLAMGHHLVVHDFSEKPFKHHIEIRRETRACWQGMQFIRYVAERVWQMPPTSAYGRNREQLMNPQFSYMYDELLAP